MPKKDHIMVFAAHNDDPMIGVGGTLIKYAKEKKKISIFIFSYGESSHPHFAPDRVIKIRKKEYDKSAKIMNLNEYSEFFGLKEGNFKDEFKEKKLKKKIKEFIKNKKPSKIFTHSKDDPHPDHKAVHNILMEILDELKYKCDVYSFDVWNPINFRKRSRPKLVVDITDTFEKKIKACKCHESQKVVMVQMIPLAYTRAFINGLNYNHKYAEIFFKIR